MNQRTVIEFVQNLGLLLLLAQDDASADAPGFFDTMAPPLLLIIPLFYFMILRPQRNKENEFRSMIENLKEKDRVVTVGGIHGVVTNVQRDAELVTLRVDESTGAKIRVGVSAISKVVVEEDKGG